MNKYGNLINNILDDSKDQVPIVGMGATLLMWSDRVPYVITEVLSDCRVAAARVGYTIEDYYVGYGEADLSKIMGEPEIFILRKNGRWVKKGQDLKQGQTLKIGVATIYRDPHF